MASHLTFDAKDESETDHFAAALARVLPAGAVVALIGTLGAGKTRLVQAVARAVGIDSREVVSPTFVLVHEYEVRVQGSRHGGHAGIRVQGAQSPKSKVQSPTSDAGDLGPWTLDLGPSTPADQTTGHETPPSRLYHLDAYRIKDDDEFHELGPEEYFESDGWTFVEWADRVADCLPSDYLQIAIEVIAPTARRFTLTAVGNRFGLTIEAIRAALAA